MVTPIRIVVVDAHEMVRRSLAMSMELFDDLELVGQVGNGKRGLALCAELAPDVVITELQLPDLDGVFFTSWITDNCPQTKVIVLDTLEPGKEVEAVLQAGAAKYLVKEISINELAGAIREVVYETGYPQMDNTTGVS